MIEQLPKPRAMQTVVSTPYGDIYLFGGSTPTYHLSDDIWRYDPIGDSYDSIDLKYPFLVRQSLGVFIEDWG